MIGEPDAGNPHVRFDEGRQETCARAARLSPTLQSPQWKSDSFPKGSFLVLDFCVSGFSGQLALPVGCGQNPGMGCVQHAEGVAAKPRAPIAVLYRLQSDELSHQSVTDKGQLSGMPELAPGTHPPHLPAGGVFDLGQTRRIRSTRSSKELRRRFLLQRFVGALLVI